ncbi:MAG: electron transfer flavoprotein subunit beta/FixA family protein [Chloroflexi bacterium]|nr:electron transfer flavoprotein subunit beta/FixA family protein [Chloroflexota bacterium]
MNIIVPIRLTPDLVEEIHVTEDGLSLDPDWLRLKINEFDDHAIEEAILLKERGLGAVTVIGLGAADVDDALFTAAAKGADRIVKLTLDEEQPLGSHALARLLAPLVKDLEPGLILTGVQAHNDLDGPLGPYLAELLGFPYIGYVSAIKVKDGVVTAFKEFPGGVLAELETYPPVALGVQAAEQPPRYVAFSKIRQASKSTPLEEKPADAVELRGGARLQRMFLPDSAGKAEMLSGGAEAVSARLVEIFVQAGAL